MSGEPVTVSGLSVTVVKGTRLRTVDQISLQGDGARGNRRFFLIDDHDRMLNAKVLGALQTVIADYTETNDHLALTFPDGSMVDGSVRRGAPVNTQFFSRSLIARLVDGPWSEALSEYIGRPLRLVEADGDGAGVDRGAAGTVTLISQASLTRLASAAGEAEVDPRRFRMLIEVNGAEAHEEDGWVGRATRVGEALVAWGGHVGRCLITSRDPDSGKVDLATLDILRDYRDESATTEPLPFGIYGQVLEGGVVRLGDKVTPL